MRKLLMAMAASGALLAGGAAVPASAADLGVAPAPAPYIAPVAVAYTWSGSYLGLNAGGIWGKHEFDPVSATLIAGPLGGECALPSIGSSCGFSLTTSRDSSFIGGIHFGDRWQFGQFVIGVEQDAQWTDVKNGFVLGANA
jgi:outer membrane immunogenic protein